MEEGCIQSKFSSKMGEAKLKIRLEAVKKSFTYLTGQISEMLGLLTVLFCANVKPLLWLLSP